MRTYTIHLPDDVARMVERRARTQHGGAHSPEQVIGAAVEAQLREMDDLARRIEAAERTVEAMHGPR